MRFTREIWGLARQRCPPTGRLRDGGSGGSGEFGRAAEFRNQLPPLSQSRRRAFNRPGAVGEGKLVTSFRRQDDLLTFDDGPGPYTQKVLDVLKDNDVKATFFIIGK